MDKDHVVLVDLKATSVDCVTEEGIKTSDGKVHPLDVLIVATGFDALTGGYLSMTITGRNGEKLSDHWKDGTFTNYGMSVNGFPNWFFTYVF